MSDIDFDELDKAVNSLMGKAGEPKEKEKESPEKTLEIDSTLKGDEEPKYDALSQAAKEIGSETLDSNDNKTVVEDLGTSHETTVSGVLEPEAPENVTPPLAETPVSPVVPIEPPAAKRPSSGRFMDMVHPSADMRPAGPQPSPAPRLVGPVPPKSVVADTPSSTAPLPPSEEIAASSPFLADAKVEKRPLGSEPPTGGPATYAAAETAEANVVASQPDLEVASKDMDSTTPDIKSDDEQQPLNAEDFSSENARQAQQLQSIESAADSGGSNKAIQSIESGDTEKMLKTPAMTDDKTALLAHPPKQKSGWGIVVVIVIVIILSAAVAGAAYFFVIKQ